MQYSLVGSRFVLQYKLYCEPGWACVTIQHGLGSWGAGVGAGARRCGRWGARAERAGIGEAGARQGTQEAGACKGARGGRLGGLCASGVLSWARLGVLVHLTQFLAWFDSVFS